MEYLGIEGRSILKCIKHTCRVGKRCLVSRGSRCGSVATGGKGDNGYGITCLHTLGAPSCLRLPWCIILCNLVYRKLIPAAVLYNAQVCCRSIDGTVSSNPAEGMDTRLLCVV
jgi:hypothetical protein